MSQGSYTSNKPWPNAGTALVMVAYIVGLLLGAWLW